MAIGASRAKELIFQRHDAQKALHYGLVNEIAEDPLKTPNLAGN
ncbi:MAG: hypothetical protein R2875_14225 [Desulfobacterales bacterium]